MAEDPLIRSLIDGYYEDSDRTHLMVLSDVLEEREDKRYLRIQTLLKLWDMASSIPFPTSKGPRKSSLDGYGGDSSGPNSLYTKAGRAGVSIHAFLSMRWCPRYFFSKKLPPQNQWPVWNLITTPEAKRTVMAAELFWCELIDRKEMCDKSREGKKKGPDHTYSTYSYDEYACLCMAEIQFSHLFVLHSSYEFGVCLANLIIDSGTREAGRPNDRRLRDRIRNKVKRWMCSLARMIPPFLTNLPKSE